MASCIVASAVPSCSMIIVVVLIVIVLVLGSMLLACGVVVLFLLLLVVWVIAVGVVRYPICVSLRIALVGRRHFLHGIVVWLLVGSHCIVGGGSRVIRVVAVIAV